MTYYVYLILMTVIGSVASYYFKKISESGELTIISMLMNKYLYIGGILYFISSLINIYILRYLDYSVVLPLTSITYIWTMLISYRKLYEKVTGKKIIGVTAILIGAVLVAL